MRHHNDDTTLHTRNPSDTMGEHDDRTCSVKRRRPLHLQEPTEQYVRPVFSSRRRMRRSSKIRVLSGATALLVSSLFQCEANELVTGTLATVLQSQGAAARPDQRRDRFVSAAALFVTGSMMMNAAADEKPEDPLTQSMIPIEDLPFQGSGQSNHIGDGVRSDVSSSHFFQSIDSDGDGTLQAPELADVVREYIADTSSDTGVEDEVSRVMKKLDRNDEEGVDSSDVFAYWKQLESLLTVDEVAEWVVCAVQMPEYVGNTFRENFVTGYDFPELVENGGEALQSELNIEKSSFRKKITKHVYARLLGIGSVPTPPSDVKHELESCSTVSFKWEKSTAIGFPVHNYRVQRRVVNLYRTESNDILDQLLPDDVVAAKDTDQLNGDAQCAESGLSSDSEYVAKADASVSSDWVTMYVGGETEFIDTSLEPGKNYLYRFQAWNSVGRSAPWVTVDISRSLKKQKCTLPKNFVLQDRNWTSNETSVLSFLFWSGGTLLSGSYFLLQLLLTGLALASAIMRFKRASAKSTAVAGSEPVAPTLWNGLNSFFARVLGVELVSSSELGENSTLRHSKNLHDKSVNAVGLNGYKQDSNLLKGDPQGRRLAFQKRQALSASDVTMPEGSPALRPSKNVSFRINRNSSMRTGLSAVEYAPEENVANGTIFVPSRDTSPYRVSRDSSINSQDSSDSGCGCEMEDDHTRCNSCRKRYKFGKRWRHHCARCMSTFCHKHGRTTHTNLTSCKVPGTCICDVCLEIEQFNQKDSSPKSTPKGTGKRWLGRKQRLTEGNKPMHVPEPY